MAGVHGREGTRVGFTGLVGGFARCRDWGCVMGCEVDDGEIFSGCGWRVGDGGDGRAVRVGPLYRARSLGQGAIVTNRDGWRRKGTDGRTTDADVCACGLVDTRTGRVSCRPYVYEVALPGMLGERYRPKRAAIARPDVESERAQTPRFEHAAPSPPSKAAPGEFSHPAAPLPPHLDQIQVRPFRSPADNRPTQPAIPPAPLRSSTPTTAPTGHPRSTSKPIRNRGGRGKGGKTRSVSKVYAKKNAMGRTQKPGKFSSTVEIMHVQAPCRSNNGR